MTLWNPNLRIALATRLLTLGAAMSLQLLLAAPGRAEEISFSYIETGASSGAQEAMVVSSGSWFTRRKLSHGAVLIQHPDGDLLYDTGLGRQVDAQFEVNPWWARALFAYDKGVPVADQLAATTYDVRRLKAIVLSHLHWDHASGVADFPGVPIWVQQKEYDAALEGAPPAFLHSQLEGPNIDWRFLTLGDTEFKGFERSLDVYGDGSVVLVEIPGHTRGQLGLYLTLNAQTRYFFIGDATWTLKGVRDDSPRPGFVRWMANLNDDDGLTQRMVTQLHNLQQVEPDLTIVPAHDELIAADLPHYPEFSSQ
ncbi:Zn-dependent Hydrolase, including glyoxylases [Hahella chejuensis KCTC 2396]|uniref:Zn-dependent Hydrolase, including glyoxylases n=1 Tax=Hahella chejuensis (strain KCTC 2396) TaxID=349521 RepID=Q2S7X0_HAHCH|nr:MBL fold metallo-hydrolase [Hahella chejuensis]ABC33254.1 Zn-dependent Hydrolase, including glyoxylases [Hahella chejuensis KCTC 2396]